MRPNLQRVGPGQGSRSSWIGRMSSIAVSVGVLSTLLSMGPGAHAATTTFKPVADTWVNAARPGSNYGGGTVLKTDASPIYRTYLRFNLQNLSGSITKATLRLHATTSNAVGPTIASVASTTWGEKTITYSNAPPIGATLGTGGAVTSGAWLSVDVTSAVAGNGLLSFGVTSSSSTTTKYSSRETSSAPQLVVETTGSSTTFPIRAAFYYPWYPEHWTSNGVSPWTHYHPSLGLYSSSNLSIVQNHIAAMLYGHITLGITSWWGQGTNTDDRVPTLLQAAAGTSFHWAIYYEQEGYGNPSASQISSDLTYIQNHYAANDRYMKINGRFVVFVYGGTEDCTMADRWFQGNTVNAYIVLKIATGYSTCTHQPDGWHRYNPKLDEINFLPYAFVISPGFWGAGDSAPTLTRDLTRWNKDIQDMIASGAKWQLITTFNEWNEGTSVESATEWSTSSGYGSYLDALHNNP